MKNTPFQFLDYVDSMIVVFDFPRFEARFFNQKFNSFAQWPQGNGGSWSQWFGLDNFNQLREACLKMVAQNLERIEGSYVLENTQNKIHVVCQSVELEGQTCVVLTLSENAEVQQLSDLVVKQTKFADVGKMTAGIAHELNNPLSILQGHTDHLEILIEKGKLEPESMKRMVLAFQKAIDRMNRIVKSMSSLVKEQSMVFHNYTLEEIIGETLNLDRATLKHAKVQVDFTVEKQHVVSCDFTRVEQSILYLLSYLTTRFTDATQPATIKINTSEVDKQVVLQLTANCTPLAPELVQQNFVSKLSLDENSHALSLFAIHKTLQKMGAKLDCLKSDLSGTVFEMRFSAAQVVTQAADLNGMRTLVVDDEELVRQIFAEKLLDLGCFVDEAPTGDKALEMIGSKEYDLVISDMRMVGMQGDELITKGSALKPDLSFVITTGFSTFAIDTSHISSSQFLGVLKKPLVEEEFVKILNVAALKRSLGTKQAA